MSASSAAVGAGPQTHAAAGTGDELIAAMTPPSVPSRTVADTP